MKRIFGLAAIAAGAVLFIFFRDLELGWFTGGPLGVGLMVLGAIELVEGRVRRRPRGRGMLDELRDDLSLRSSRDRDRDRDYRDRDYRDRDYRDRDYRDRDDRDRDYRDRDDRDRDYRDRGRRYRDRPDD
ncbi:hypothetical protein [Nonomuraea candida]|uniref:hypothetical protein n=1 Tax=Nonomuraea candida TaxID=359159 RepID=UPI0007C83A2A|nr:hypothetical protein [Nonomuraea candida]